MLGQVETEELQYGDRRPDRGEDDHAAEQRLESRPARDTVGGAERDTRGGTQREQRTICRADLGGVERVQHRQCIAGHVGQDVHEDREPHRSRP